MICKFLCRGPAGAKQEVKEEWLRVGDKPVFHPQLRSQPEQEFIPGLLCITGPNSSRTASESSATDQKFSFLLKISE